MAYTFKQKLFEGNDNAQFGYSVALDGYSLVVGSPAEQSVYVYRRTISGDWESIKRITYALPSLYGSSLDIDGRYLAVGVPVTGASGGVAFYSKDQG